MPKEDDLIETALAALEELDEKASIEKKNEALESFAETLTELPTGTQALVLNEARELLTWVSAPARTLQRYVEQTSDSETNGEQEDAARTLNYSDPTPAEGPVDGNDLLAELVATFRRYVVLPDGASTAIALWTLFSYAFDEFAVAPILAITSPTHRCGKSTLLHVLKALVSRPQMASHITAAAVYRVVEQAKPTLLIDEADSFMKPGGRLRNVLNAGHLKTGEVILCSGDEHDVRPFSAHSPKAIALIGELPSTLTDRSIPIPMRRKAPGETVEQLRLDRIGEECQELRQKVAQWVQDHRDELDTTATHAPDELDDRAADNWRPLLAIAEVAGGMWIKRAASSARLLSGGEQGKEKDAAIELLHDIHAVLCAEDADRIRSKTLAEELGELEGRPWATWSNGRCITQNALANMLRPFGIKPRELWFGTGRENGANYRGYERQAFRQAFLRYGILDEGDVREEREAA